MTAKRNTPRSKEVKGKANPAGGKQRRLRGAAPDQASSRRPGRRTGGGGVARSTPAATLVECIPTLLGSSKAFGAAVIVAVADRAGEQAKISHAIIEEVFQRPGMRPKGRLLDRADPGDLARLLGGLAHPDRVRLAKAVLAGACSHHQLNKEMKLRTGPLYHHLRELERAGILVKAARNLYTVTEQGRLVLHVATVLAGFGAAAHSAWRCTGIKCGKPLRRRVSRSAKPTLRPRRGRPGDRRRG